MAPHSTARRIAYLDALSQEIEKKLQRVSCILHLHHLHRDVICCKSYLQIHSFRN
ncbi:unnamed protein product [Rhodiola kirilowii]